MTSRNDAAAVLFTTDFGSLARFYERVVGMSVHADSDTHVVLRKGGFRLTVHQIPERYARSIVITTPPQVREASSIKLAFPVEDLGRSREIAAGLGGCVYAAEREWVDESSRICDGWDPDGNVFQLFAPATPQGEPRC